MSQGGYQIVDFNFIDFNENSEPIIDGIYEKLKVNKPILAQNIKYDIDIFTIYPNRIIRDDAVYLMFNIAPNNVAEIVVRDNNKCEFSKYTLQLVSAEPT